MSLPFNPPKQAGLSGKRLERMRWRCRRGLLELDIVLGRFVEKLPLLEERQQQAFEALLDMPDTLLWDMIAGRQPAPSDANQRALLEMLQVV